MSNSNPSRPHELNEHPHPHPHEHDEDRHEHEQHEHEHHDHKHDDHGHEHGGFWNEVKHLIRPHAHTHYTAALDPALANQRGIWALKVSLVGLLVTAIFQVFIVAISGSVALLADTLHNFSDALTAVPLWLAFALARRTRNRRYTYGYGRAEDLAGAFIVLMIFASAVVVFYESIQKFFIPSRWKISAGWPPPLSSASWATNWSLYFASASDARLAPRLS